MKKLMTLAVIAATAFAAHAAQFIWGAEIQTDTGYAAETTVLFLFQVDSSFGALDASAVIALFDGSAGTLTGGTDISSQAVDIGYWSDAISTPGSEYAGTWSMSSITFEADASAIGGWYAVIAWDLNTPDALGFHAFLVPSNPGPLDPPFNASPAGGVLNMVPEPFTVGLALAGVALLIAQRKRK